MSRRIDITGQKFGRLTVEGQDGHIRKEIAWKCLCDCGKEVRTSGYALRSGHTVSCGCYMIERIKSVSRKHGFSDHPLYVTWGNMQTRCYNPKYYLFERYGGRGISVCDEWRGENGFQRFFNWSYSNGWEKGKSLDRIDNDGDYSPDNCRWTTMREQQNNRSNNRRITVAYVNKTAAEWSRSIGVHYTTVLRWCKAGIAEKRIEEHLVKSS